MQQIKVNEQALIQALKNQVLGAFNKPTYSGMSLPVHIFHSGNVILGDWLSDNSWVENVALTYRVKPWETELEEYDLEVEVNERLEFELEDLKVRMDEDMDYKFILE